MTRLVTPSLRPERPSRMVQRLKSEAATSAATRDYRKAVGLSLFTATLMYVGFYPLNLGFTGWFCLVPLLFLTDPRPLPRWLWVLGFWRVQSEDRQPLPLRSCLWASWWGGLAFCLVAYQWIRIASWPMYFPWIGLALMMSLQFPLFVWLTRRLVHTLGLPLLLVAPAAWTALEFLRAIIGIGFAWYYLGHTQHEVLPLIQFADLTGTYGISFLLVMVNVVLFQLATRQWRPFAVSFAVCLAGVGGAWAYGVSRLNEAKFTPGPKLALVQGNLAQDIRNDPTQSENTNDHYLKLAHQAAALRPDLVVIPETALEVWYHRNDPATPQSRMTPEWAKEEAASRLMAQRFGQHFGTEFLFGLVTISREPTQDSKYNGAVHFGKDGVEKNWYAKMYCLPFGEYIPWKDTLPFMKWFSPYDFEYSTENGNRWTIFDIKSTPAAVLICYEDTVPHLARRFMTLPTKPAFFLNLSNDGWFKGWEEHEQHWVTAKFRCIECRRALARSVNIGISGIIDGNGATVALPGNAKTLSEAKGFSAVVLANVPLDNRDSLYVTYGDWMPVASWLFVVGGMIMALLKARREDRLGLAAAPHLV